MIFKKQTVAQATFIIIFLSLLTKIAGYLREILVAKYFGVSYETDSFIVAMLIPSMVFGVFSMGIQTVLIREYAERRKLCEEKAKNFVNHVFLFFFILFIIISILIIIFNKSFVRMVAFGFTGKRLELSSYFIKYLTPYGFSVVLSGMFVAIFQTENQFLYPALMRLIGNMIIPASLLIFSGFIGIKSWIIGQDLAGIFVFLSLFLVLKIKKGLFNKFEISKSQIREILEFIKLIIPVIATGGIGVIYQLIDKMVASFLPYGSIAALNFAQKVFLIPYTIIVISIITATFPSFSRYAVSDKIAEYSELFKKTIVFLSYTMVPISLIFILFPKPIVKILFERGAFSENATIITSTCVALYSIGLLPYSLSNFFNRIFFSFKEMNIPMYVAFLTTLINLTLNFVFARIWKAPGIALATSLTSYISFIIYTYILLKKRKFKKDSLSVIPKEILKIISATFITLILFFLFKSVIPNFNKNIEAWQFFIPSSVLIIFCYILFTWIFKSDGFKLLKNYLATINGTITKK